MMTIIKKDIRKIFKNCGQSQLSFIVISKKTFSNTTKTPFIIDGKNVRGFVPTEKLEFEKNNKCLLYYYRPRFYTYLFLYARFGIPFWYITQLLRFNPFTLTFPAATPIMIGMEIFLLKKIFDQKQTFRQVVTEIYLHKDGETLEVIYENQFWRKFKQEKVYDIFHIPTLKSPQESSQILPLKGDKFPTEFPFEDLRPAGWCWRKYYRTSKNFFSVPKNSNYVNLEVLIQVFDGQHIDTSKKNITQIDDIKKERYMKI